MSADPHDPGTAPITIYCTQCGRPMLVAPEHTRIAVTCPHCRHTLEPWRVMATVAGQHRAAGPGRLAPYDPTIYSTRNRWVAGALGILLGQFGVHRFYMGYVDIGILQIIVTLVTCGIGGIWGFIEGILCFCGAMQDVDGLPLRS